MEKYYNGLQEDAAEFIQRLLTQDTGCPALAPFFAGQDKPSLHCTVCNNGTREIEPEWFGNVVVQLKNERNQTVANVQEALDGYMPPEVMDRNFNWTCPNCRSNEAPVKIHNIEHTPVVLFVLLCRWTHAHDAGAILDKVQVNEEVTFHGERYKLRSSVLHIGRSPLSGHYVSVARHETRYGEWWYYNDEMRRAARPGEIQSSKQEKS